MKVDKLIVTPIQASEEKYHTLFDSNRDSITIFRIDSDGKPENFIEVNPATTAIFGYSKKELLSMSVLDIEKVSDKKRQKRIETLQLEGRIDYETIIKNKKGNFRNVEIETLLINYLNNPAVMNITRDITERKQGEDYIKKVQQNLSTILEAIPDLLFEVGQDGRIHHYQAHRDDLLAVPPSEFMGKLFQEILPPDVVQTCMEAIEEANKNGWSTGKQYSLDLPQGKHWFELSVSPIKESSILDKHFIILARDITERKKAEDALRKSDEKIKGIFNLANSGILLTDIQGTILEFNDWWLKNLNYSRKEFSNMTNLSITHPEDLDKSKLWLNKIVNGEIEKYQIEKRYVRKDNSFFWGEISVSSIKDKSNKTINTIGIVTDITERKLAESKLIASDTILKQTQSIAKLGSYSLDFNTGIWSSTSVLDTIFGIDDNFDRTIKGWVSIIHPEWQTIMTDYLTYEVIGKKVNFNKEYKIIKLDSKEVRWVHGMGEITFDKENNPLHLIGSIQDITERKQAEEKLKLSSEKFQNLVNSTGGIVWEADAKTFNFTFVSQEAERLLGYSLEEWKTDGFWANHLHPDEKVKTINFCISQTKKMEAHDFIYRFKSKNSTYVWLRDIVNVVIENGKPRWLRGVMFDITKLKETNQLLIESEEKYRGLVENSPDGIVIYAEEKIVFINDEGLKMLGATKKEEIITKPVLQFVHPDSLRSVIQRMEEVVADNKASEIVEEQFININGVSFDVEIKAIPTIYEHQNAVQVIVHDITERKRTQEKIKQLSQAVEQSPVAIVITNTNGAIEYVNPKFTETTGYSFDEILGQNSRILKSGHTSHNEYQHLWKTLISGNEWFGEFHNKRKDGTLYWESASISPILNSQGKTTHYIAIKEDITERKHVEQQLIKAKEKAEESDRLKLSFLANMSHEIRTPMNGILGFTELLKEPNLDSHIQQDYIKIIEKSGIRMLNIINDIISISKIESGQVEVNLSDTNINEQIEYLHTFFKPEATHKGIKLLVVNLLPSNETTIKTDREKIYAILTNLIKNALKFTNGGSIEIGCDKKGNYLEFFVKDTGLGISNSQIKIIFERFRQANDTISRSHEGSGLGLAISKAYVETLGGKIWVESEEGKGSTFYFTIPYNTKSQQNEKIETKKIVSKEKSENKIKDLKILIVEDDSISKLLITIAVKPFSKEIIKVSTGFEAIKTCRNNPDIDLVMMDINMPEMGGYEATKLIRKFNKDLVIIAQTANGMQSDRDEAIAAGCTDYISKPINISSLSELIQKYFEK
jgi:PAS domain S-box-containing protein